MHAAPIVMIGAALLAQSPASASPDGAEWETADDPEGCRSCHLGAPEISSAAALTLDGLPETPEAGEAYQLTITLVDAALKNAGFLLSIDSDGSAAGRLESKDGRTESSGSRARSNWDGSFPAEPGKSHWQLVWTAPAVIDGAFSFDLWANAGNDDLSPLGDRPYHRRWDIPARP